MKKAKLIFKDNTPFSLDFDDFYFNSKDGLNESKFVYTHSFEWKNQENFIIAESGFGIGLNFFLTLKRLLETTPSKRPKKLFYISVEAFYIEKEQLREIYQKLEFYEEFKELLEQFLKFYPKAKEGIYRFYFEDCFLDLVFEDIAVLKELDFKADVWYLDGFSPNKNLQMFDENLIFEVARLSKKNTQICTFSSASFLQKNLKVLIIKHDPADKAQFDFNGKDSFKFFQSGAEVMVLSPTRTTFFSHENRDILKALKLSPDFDICLVEGLKTLDLPRISVFCKEIDESYFIFSNAIASYEKISHPYLTWLDLNDIQAICQYILKNAKNLQGEL